MKNSLVMMNLMTGLYWFDDALQASLGGHGWEIMTRAQSLLISNLSAGEHSPSQLARNLGVSRQAISQMLAELEARGVVTMETDPKDRRARIVNFSRKSIPLRDAARSVLRQLEAELESRLGRKVFAAMKTGLEADWGALPEVKPIPELAEPAKPARKRRRAG